jgi:hypothetical protein
VTLLKLKRAVIFTAFFLIGCASEQTRLNRALDIAAQHDYITEIISTNFPIKIFHQNHNSKLAAIYLEGDGLVINKHGEVAFNPSPTDPMALRLAVVDNRQISKIVINRPYHYFSNTNANSKYWTTARYSPEIIRAILETIKTYQQKFKFETIEIVAYSGGAAVALLLASHLNNITRIVSFAGNLDHVNWTKYHDAQPLFESLDPLQDKAAIAKIPQTHFVGESDDNTTVDLAQTYKQKVSSDNIIIVPIPGFSHDSNWPQIWQAQIKVAARHKNY